MTKEQEKPAWRDVLKRSGLQVLEKAAQNGPPVLSAIYAVTGFEVKPVATVPISAPSAADDLDAKWASPCLKRLALRRQRRVPHPPARIERR
jgi:hypothetical protein